jgi:hypothetical protein
VKDLDLLRKKDYNEREKIRLSGVVDANLGSWHNGN